MFSLAARRFLKSSFRPSISNPLIFSFHSQQFPEPKKPTLIPSPSPFVRSLNNFRFVSHFSTSLSNSTDDDEFFSLMAEIDRLEKEFKSENETLGQRIEEFEAKTKEVAGLDVVEREKKIGPMHASLKEFFEKVKAKRQRLEDLNIRKEDMEVERIKSKSQYLGEGVEKAFSERRGKSVSNEGANNNNNISRIDKPSSGSRENEEGEEAGSNIEDLMVEIDRLEKEVESEKEILGKKVDEFGDVMEEVEGLDLVEMEKKKAPIRESLIEFFENVKAKHERLENLRIRLQDMEVERIKSKSPYLGETVEKMYSQLGRHSEVSNEVSNEGANNNISWIDKPSVTWMLLWPSMWSITLAASPGHLPDFEMLALFGFGAWLLRGSVCSVNDLFYRDNDTKVGETKLGQVGSGLLAPSGGLWLLGFQWLLGLGILLQLNQFCRVLAAPSLLLACSYPLMKRFTFWRQAYRGLILNWGALLGWAAIKGNLDPSIVLPLYASGIFCTLVNDVINTHQDKGAVKSTAIHFGDSTKEWTTGFGIASLGCLALSGFNAELGLPYYALLAVAAGHLGWQIKSVDLSSRADFNIGWKIASVDLASLADRNNKFVSNKWFGAIIFAGILAGKLSS